MPVIKLLGSDSLHQHEEIEVERYFKLKEKMKNDAVQKNPVIVTPLTGNKYLVLDGAHRSRVIKDLGYDKVLCQVVSESEFVIDSWTHNLNLNDYSSIDFFKDTKTFESGLTLIVNDMNKRYVYGLGDILNNDQCLGNYKNLVKEISEKRSFERGISDKDGVLNIKYPTLDFQKIKILIERNEVLPAGVTQISIKTGRVMCVNIPLYKLENNYRDLDYIGKIEEKLRFYNEPIYLYEER
ncbi:ParB N-terminal domain-containing protein [Staphylococcus epidermidis]